jgi:hypothetical protein
MILLLLYASMHCADAIVLQERINSDEHLPPEVKLELLEVVMEATPECAWDAKAD